MKCLGKNWLCFTTFIQCGYTFAHILYVFDPSLITHWLFSVHNQALRIFSKLCIEFYFSGCHFSERLAQDGLEDLFQVSKLLLMFKYPFLFSYYDFRLTLSLRAWLIFSLFLLSLFILFSFVYLLFILFRFPELPDEDKATA